jgi:outer membrane biosynthesis protein TonB
LSQHLKGLVIGPRRNFALAYPSQTSDLMPSTPIDPESPELKPAEPDQRAADRNAPVSFVPHAAPGELPSGPVRIRTNRYGELEEHELVKLLDSIEDERARSRFRESIYISVFFWIVVAWLIFYGPRYLWHSPQLINPADAIRKQELTQLNAPVLLHNAPRIAPKPVPRQLDNNTLKQLQAMKREAPAPAPAPSPAPSNIPPTPQPVAPPPSPAPRAANPIIPEAPAPQHPTQPNFNTPSTAGSSLQQAIHDSARTHDSGSGGGLMGTSKGAAVGGGVQVLSDMQGVDFSDYLRRLKADVYHNWIPLLPEETEPPILKQGETYIVFTILPDGKIGEMHLEASTKDVAIDKAAWGSIVSEGQFPPLPTQFHGPNLTLRFHYIVNKGIGQ